MFRYRVALAGALLSTSAWSVDYHVAITGDDSHPGTMAQPWRTLQHAVEAVGPGDAILVHTGTYVGARIEQSGLDGSEILLRTATDEAVVLSGPGPQSVHDSTIEVETFSGSGVVAYWRIEGFEILGGSRSGVDLRNVHHVTVRNNVVHSSGRTGIFTAFADDVLIEDNESYGNGEHGVYTSNSGDRPTVRGNHLHDNFAAGLHMNADLSQGGDGIISEALVENNRIHGNGVGGGAGINMDGVEESAILNNLIYDEHAGGITLFQQDGAVCSRNNLVAYNTVATAEDGRWALNMPSSGCAGNRLVGNIFWTDHSWRGSVSIGVPDPEQFQSHHNVVMDRFSTDGGNTRIDLAAWQALGHGADSILATPPELFEDALGGNYHLALGSPAVDAGVSLVEVVEDLEGTVRPLGVAADTGCYERTPGLFADAFESGDLVRWGVVLP